MTEELLARWREAQDKLKQAKEALDSFQEFVVEFQEEQVQELRVWAGEDTKRRR